MHDPLIPLRRLVITYLRAGFGALEMLLQRTPNLKFLMLRSYGDIDMIDALRWQQLIEDCLPLLRVLKFIFHFDIADKECGIVDKLRLFQNCFWQDQHHWYIGYAMNNDETFVYTIPYMLDSYEITSITNIYYSHPVNKMNLFAKVTDLTVNIGEMTDLDQYCFPSVRSLTLNSISADTDFKSEHILSLKAVANLSNLAHLKISAACQWNSSSIVTQLMQEALRLASLTTGMHFLYLLLENPDSCECVKMIKELDNTYCRPGEHLDYEAIAKICQTLSIF